MSHRNRFKKAYTLLKHMALYYSAHIGYLYTPARYIVEWLGAMVCGGMVEVVSSAEEDRYFLPKHRHELLLGPAAIFHAGLPILGAAHEDIVNCFPKSGPAGMWSCFVLHLYLGLIFISFP